MPKREKRPRKPPRPSAPDQPAPAAQDEHRERVTDAVARREEERRSRPEEMRMDMMRSIVTEPLLSQVQKKVVEGRLDYKFDVIISLNELFSGGIEAALEQVVKRAEEWQVRYTTVSHYCFACLTVQQIVALADEARELYRTHGRQGSVVHHIWEDTNIEVALTKSIATVKADAAQRSFAAHGRGMVWAVLDSGIQGDHPHFARKSTPFGDVANLEVNPPLVHMDFTPHGRSSAGGSNTAVEDEFGHGTHVAGIIAGSWRSAREDGEFVVGTEMRDDRTNEPVRQRGKLTSISGVAPLCTLLSLKVIADRTLGGDARQTAGQGKVSWVLLALDQIQQWNQHGRRLMIHGVNMSLGYDFDPRWFGCGQSPLCVEVNRLVRSGVSVVVSAGNSGYSAFVMASGRSEAHYSALTITDPGNAELAITVGSTHKEMPHTYGVSYFSSRGPTGDGRPKPDMLAPGERIVSCAAGAEARKYGTVAAGGTEQPVLYCEQTGTSMAAPHVSGAIAVFLSARAEFIGQPERVKEIFMANCIDLRRERSFQGAGLLDLMKVLQGV